MKNNPGFTKIKNSAIIFNLLFSLFIFQSVAFAQAEDSLSGAVELYLETEKEIEALESQVKNITGEIESINSTIENITSSKSQQEVNIVSNLSLLKSKNEELDRLTKSSEFWEDELGSARDFNDNSLNLIIGSIPALIIGLLASTLAFVIWWRS